MKKCLIVVVSFALLITLCGKVMAYTLPNLPSEVSRVDWTKLPSSSNVYISSNCFVALDYDWTPDEYYWKRYNMIRSRGYSDRIARDVCEAHKAEYSASYYATKPFSENTVQFYVHFPRKDNGEYMVILVSCDVTNNRYRVIAEYIFKKNDNGSIKIIQKDEMKGNWNSIVSDWVIYDSYKYYMGKTFKE